MKYSGFIRYGRWQFEPHFNGVWMRLIKIGTAFGWLVPNQWMGWGLVAEDHIQESSKAWSSKVWGGALGPWKWFQEWIQQVVASLIHGYCTMPLSILWARNWSAHHLASIITNKERQWGTSDSRKNWRSKEGCKYEEWGPNRYGLRALDPSNHSGSQKLGGEEKILSNVSHGVGSFLSCLFWP